MPHVELTEQEWQQVLNLIATAPWRDANPLLMKIGGQLQGQAAPARPGDPNINANSGKEAHHE
jgi:hypothetical protein